jgi:hypothetical protein
LIVLKRGFSANLVTLPNLSNYFFLCLVFDERVNVLCCCVVKEKNPRPIDDEYSVAVLFEAQVET